MHRLRRTAVFVAAATGLAVAATGVPVQAASTPAKALKPGHWTQVTGKLTNIDDIGLARGKDGVLHVLWTSGGTNHRLVADTPISSAGVVGKPVTIQPHIFAATNPDATVTSAGLAVFWNAVRSSAPNSQIGTFEATRPSRGGTWKVASVTPTTFSWGDFVSASAGPTGTAWTDFGNSNGIVVHHLGHAPVQLKYSTCCVYSEGVGIDSKTGTTWVTYLSLRPHHMGLFAQRVTAAGKPSGSPILLPASNEGGSPLTINQRITATGLGGKRPASTSPIAPAARTPARSICSSSAPRTRSASPSSAARSTTPAGRQSPSTRSAGCGWPGSASSTAGPRSGSGAPNRGPVTSAAPTW